MKSIFISGTMSIKNIPSRVIQSIETIESKNFTVLVGDAPGVDALVQKKMAQDGYKNVLVYTVLENPRNYLSEHSHIVRVPVDPGIKSQRKKQEEKDRSMTEAADYALVLWDGKSRGSYNNRGKRAIYQTRIWLASQILRPNIGQKAKKASSKRHCTYVGLAALKLLQFRTPS